MEKVTGAVAAAVAATVAAYVAGGGAGLEIKALAAEKLKSHHILVI